MAKVRGTEELQADTKSLLRKWKDSSLSARKFIELEFAEVSADKQEAITGLLTLIGEVDRLEREYGPDFKL